MKKLNHFSCTQMHCHLIISWCNCTKLSLQLTQLLHFKVGLVATLQHFPSNKPIQEPIKTKLHEKIKPIQLHTNALPLEY
jgi:hypothetical protein